MLLCTFCSSVVCLTPQRPDLRLTVRSSPPRQRLPLACASPDAPPPSGMIEINSPGSEELDVTLPQLSWRRVAFFCLNPAALSAIPIAAYLCYRLGLPVPIPSFKVSSAAARAAALPTLCLLVVSFLLEQLKLSKGIAEVKEASKCICMYALGCSFKPVQAVVVSIIISTCAAVFEELAFRGVMQTVMQMVLTLILPSMLATCLAISIQVRMAERVTPAGPLFSDLINLHPRRRLSLVFCIRTPKVQLTLYPSQQSALF